MKNTSKGDRIYRIILLGSRPLAAKIMRYFLKQKNIQLLGIITPDRDIKNWSKINLYEEAIKHKVRILQIEDIEILKPDVVFSINYPRIIPQSLTQKYRIINAHSLLPRFRGRNAVSWAIINARKDNYWKFGVTLHEIDKGIDTGKIIDTLLFDIDEHDTAYTLYKKWEKICFELIKDSLPKLLRGDYKIKVQTGNSYYYDSQSLKNKEINLSWCKDEIYDRVRAYTFPGFERPYIKIRGVKIYLIGAIKKGHEKV